MAHVGEKFALGPRRCFGLGPGSFQFRIHDLEVAIEAADAQHVERELKQPAQLFVGCDEGDVRIFLLLRGRHSAHYTLQMIPRQPGKKLVLVVDDDRTLRHALVTMLESAGFSTTGVGDGAAALVQIHEKPFDLMILDLGLPRISGLEVLAEIQKLDAPPKVIVVTADETPATVLQAIRDRAYQYIVKPTPPKTIVELVERVIAAPLLVPFQDDSARADLTVL